MGTRPLTGSRLRWLVALSAIAAALVTWRLLAARSVPAPAPVRPEGAGSVAQGSELDGTRAALASSRQPAVVVNELPPSAVPEPAADARTPLAQELERVQDSFLSPEPLVAELLALSQELAASASVDPDGLQLEHDDAGALRFARGILRVGDLSGTFLVEEDVYVVRFSGLAGGGPWGQRDLQISFRGGSGQAAGCQATVQFHPRADEPASQHVDPGEPRLAGWVVSVSPESGALARPLGVGARGDEWQIEDGADEPAIELPWVSGTGSFDTWLGLLRPHLER